MPGINDMIARVRKVDVKQTIQVATTATVKDYERLQQLQMLTGYDSRGERLGKYKNEAYAKEKHAKNPLAGLGFMDWRLSGDFFKGYFTTLNTNGVFISSHDKKTERLLKINPFGFGLNQKNLSEYSIHHIGPQATRVFKRQLHGL